MMLHQRRCRLVSSLKVENHQGLAKRLSVAPAQGFRTSPQEFAIGLTAVEEEPKTNRRPRQGSKQRTRAAERPFLLFTTTRT